MRRCFTLLEILICLSLLSIGGFTLVQYSYKYTQESIKALHLIEWEHTAAQELFFWKEHVFQKQHIPKKLEKGLSINNTNYTVTFHTNKKEQDLTEFTREKMLLYLVEVEIKKGNAHLFSRKYPVLIEVL